MEKTIKINIEEINAKELQLKPEDDLEAYVADRALNIRTESPEENFENDNSSLSDKDLIRIHTQDPYEFFD